MSAIRCSRKVRRRCVGRLTSLAVKAGITTSGKTSGWLSPKLPITRSRNWIASATSCSIKALVRVCRRSATWRENSARPTRWQSSAAHSRVGNSDNASGRPHTLHNFCCRRNSAYCQAHSRRPHNLSCRARRDTSGAAHIRQAKTALDFDFSLMRLHQTLGQPPAFDLLTEPNSISVVRILALILFDDQVETNPIQSKMS